MGPSKILPKNQNINLWIYKKECLQLKQNRPRLTAHHHQTQLATFNLQPPTARASRTTSIAPRKVRITKPHEQPAQALES
jgi:hypothetical protein